ncbi:MAG: putative ABC transporter permease subunit [Chloroflexota bacterium]
MIADTLLLLSLRWQVAWNSFRLRSPARKTLTVLGTLAIGLVIGGFSGTVGYGAGSLLHQFPQLRLEPLMPGLILTAAALLLVTSFGVALGSLFLSNDLELLMSAPVDRRALFAARILDGMATYSAILLVAAAPALVTYGIGLQYGPWYYLLALLALLGTPLLPAGLGALLVMAVARFVLARRMREALGLLGAIFGVAASQLGNISRIWMRQAGDGGSGLDAILAQLQAIANLPVPSLLAGRGLAAAGVGDPVGAMADLSGFTLLTFGFFAACVALADGLYASGWVRLQGSGSANRGRHRAAREAARGGLLGEAPAYLSIALKDWRVIPRDLRNFAQFLTPLFLLPIVYLNLLAGGDEDGAEAIQEVNGLAQGRVDLGNVFVAAAVLIAVALMFGRMARTSISIEGQAWWVLKSAPISHRELLLGKYLAAAIPFALLATALLVGAAIWRHFTLAGLLYGWFGVMLLGAGAIAINVGLAVPWARLDWEDPRRMSSGWGGLLSMVGSGLLGIVAGLLLCLPLIARVLRPSLEAAAWVVGPLGAVAVTAALAALASGFGLSRLSAVGES